MQEEIKVLRPFTPHVPKADPNYVESDLHNEIEAILSSKRFFPAYIFGGSGCGKTKTIYQAAANSGRSILRVQIGPETDRSSLIIKFALLGGDSVFIEGPVLSAMRNGSILMLDEMDRGTDDLMCMQGILEGEPVLIEETGEVVYPSEGFTVIATGNTGGRGDMTGKFIAANELDHAFLERFKVVYEMEPVSKDTERKILEKYLEFLKSDVLTDEDRAVIESLVDWAQKIRATEKSGDLDFTIATRRLNFIIEKYHIDNSIEKALSACLGVYDKEISATLRQLFILIDPVKERADLEKRRKKNEQNERLRAKRAAASEKAKKLAEQAASGNLDGSNKGRVALTGKLPNHTRSEALHIMQRAGYDISTNNISSATTLLIVGSKGSPSSAKVNRAKSLGITIMDDVEWEKKFAKTSPSHPKPSSPWMNEPKEPEPFMGCKLPRRSYGRGNSK